MTVQIIKVPFKLMPGLTHTFDAGGPDIRGEIVRCVVHEAQALPPPNRSGEIRVMDLQSGNRACILPEGGLFADELATLPLKMAAGVALRICIALKSPIATEGYALIVVHEVEPPPPPLQCSCRPRPPQWAT